MLRILVYNGGGVGDALKDMLLCQKIKDVLFGECDITHASRHYLFFHRFIGTIIKKTVSCEEVRDLIFHCEKNEVPEYDLILHMVRIPRVVFIRGELVRKQSTKLYDFCMDCQRSWRELFGNNNLYNINYYALLMGRSWVEQSDIHNVLGVSRSDEIEIPLTKDELQSLDLFGLRGKEYVTVNRDTDNMNGQAVKIYPISQYVHFLKKIKIQYPKICIVLIGRNYDDELGRYVDKNLTGKTTLGETTAILKYALLHIGSEGGLVHLRHFLAGKSLVFFGPTDSRVYGHAENINLFSKACPVCCCWLTKNWSQACILGDSVPRCLSSITADMAFIEFAKFLKPSV
ncbi:hypothetical protein [Selenomonas sp. AB3002]|uniref:glycosyltransferase family 9 protein n=1 Tax=Selenomonas sp. AB3002 TaxID=1392502 RepID=UPI000ACB5D98